MRRKQPQRIGTHKPTAVKGGYGRWFAEPFAETHNPGEAGNPGGLAQAPSPPSEGGAAGALIGS